MITGPKSSASIYSQVSLNDSPVSPVPFSEARVDRRRFAIAISPSGDGPWKHSFPSADSAVFIVELQNAHSENNAPAAGKVIQNEQSKVEGKTRRQEKEKEKKRGRTRIRSLGLLNKASSDTLAPSAPSSQYGSTSMLGKLFSRREARPLAPQSTSETLGPIVIIGGEKPEHPMLPPQVMISLPSPELNITDGWKCDDGVSVDPKLFRSMSIDLEFVISQPEPSRPTCIPTHLPSFVPEVHESTSVQPQPAVKLSTWTPKRPPSPIPSTMRRNSRVVGPRRFTKYSSPPPPVPALIKCNTSGVQTTSSVPISPPPPPPYQYHSLSKNTQRHALDDEMTIRMHLKARASKSAIYALHDGGISSPTSSIYQ
jgi:hypothetical protein